MSPLRLFLYSTSLFFIALSLSGCGNNWLVGKWTFDQERTLSAMSEKQGETPEEDQGFLKGVMSGLQKGLSQVLLSQLSGVEIEFTQDEMRRTQNGSGQAQGYEVIESPNADTRVIKYADGEINTIERIDGGLRTLIPGDSKGWLYFKPAG